MNPRSVMSDLEASGFQTVSGAKLSDSAVWHRLRSFIEDEFPSMVYIHVGGVYTMVSKGARRRMVVTKENQKTWVMYEVEGSYTPGTRWMIGKTWCTEEQIARDSAQSYELPKGLVLK